MRSLLILLVTVVALCCCEDEEIGLKTPEIISHWGYPVQTIPVTTSDGYILTIHRIPHGKQGFNPFSKRPVVFLQHGLECSSSNFITMLPNKALGFMLADAGFDVWMGNVRGNLYSKAHTTLDPSGHKFWQFTWEDMAKADTTAMIDKALQTTNQTSLYYIGHSQGTLTMFVKLASEPDFAPKIKKFFALAPVASVEHLGGMVGLIAKDFYFVFELLEYYLGEDQFFPDSKFMQIIEELICTNPVTENICDNVLFLICGPESNQFNTSRVPVYITDLPSGTSTLNIIHWAQMVRSKKLQSFDYEDDNINIQHYGNKTPPVYDLTKINVDTYLYYGDKDILGDVADIEGFLFRSLNPKILKAKVRLADFNHLDFVWGERAAKEVYKPIINTILADLK
ncbi:unnamed protein product [Enterobius vermicularis]|uniref:Lipase n=1 Tax=Enterobius vermicularis TaxID=51028 RepID=A0A0N4UW83_ENTVE|nr:unnamed protein product [Enterobius vermicularis]